VTRNVGNVVPPYGQMNGGVSSAIEYAVLALGVHHIIICGHSDCGAMRAVLNPQRWTRCRRSKPGCATPKWRDHGRDNCSCGSEHESMQMLTKENVIAQLQHLRTHPSVASRMAAVSCTSMAGSTTSRPARSKPTTPPATASCR
jgi:carbonic anhydrase